MDYKNIEILIDGKRFGLVPLDVPVPIIPIDDGRAQLSVRTERTLRSLGITHFEQLTTITEAKLLREPNFGRKSLNEVREELWRLCGLKIGQFVREP